MLLRRKEEQSEELKAFQSIVKATSVYVIWVQSIPGLKNTIGVVVKDFYVYLTTERNAHKKNLKQHNKDEKGREAKENGVVSSIHFCEKAKAKGTI